MGSALEIGIKFRKIVVISIRWCYRSVFNHPFLVAFLGFLFLLYRFFPFLFSILVSASPVLFCTAVLLGTLLSFGQPNLPEIEKEEEKEKVTTHGISSFQTGFSEGHTHTVVADRDHEGYFVKGYSENNRSDVEEESITEEASLLGKKDNSNKDNNHRDEKDQENEGVEREFHSFELAKSREIEENLMRSEVVSSDEEAIEKQYVMVEKENDDEFVDSKNEETPGDHVEFSTSSSWKQVENKDDDDEEEEESMESGSDQAESSSPDASMADIIPMLDELHPLLDLDAPQPALLSQDCSYAVSEKSHKSDDDSVESDEDAERGEGDEDGADEPDDEEEEEEAEGSREDDSKSAIKWTEDDQKNLMDLGTLELERNLRLENLIARRRARRMMSEKNLIDLDFSDIPSNVAPIATTRRNPFDFPDDSDAAAMGLPPIPGSAPSILQPRRNPFDIPYDPNEEKPDLKRDSFQQEFSMFNQKETAFFRRHESFSLGPSVLGISKHERYDINWKPIFVSERMASEGTSYSFQRQSSEMSDSKLSSVPDTESVSSIDQDDRKFSEQDLSQEADIISNIGHVSDGAEHESQSSGENESVEIIHVEEDRAVHHDEAEIVLGGVENPSEMEFCPETSEFETPEQFDARETLPRGEPNEDENHSVKSRSCYSSLSEVIDSIPVEKLEIEANLQHEDGHLEESRISSQTSGEESNFQHLSSEVEDNQRVEPVYDTSPSAAEKLQSFPSVSSDSTTEFSVRVQAPTSGEDTASLADKESEVHDQSLEDNTSGCKETHAASSELHMEVKNKLRSEKSEDISQHNVPTDAPNFGDQSGSAMDEIQDVPVPMDSNLSSDFGSVKDVTDSGSVQGQDLVDHNFEIPLQENVDSPDSNYQMPSENSHVSDDESLEDGSMPNEVSTFDDANMSETVRNADEMPDSGAYDSLPSSNDSPMSAAAYDLHLSVEAEKAPEVHPNLPPEEEVLSRSVEHVNTDIHQDLDQNVVSLPSDSQHEIHVKHPSSLENSLSSSDELVVAPSSSDHDEFQNSDSIHVESAHVIDAFNIGDGELLDATYKTPLNISSVTSEVSETPEFGPPTDEVDSEDHSKNEYQNEGLEHLDPSAESYMSQVSEESVKEFDDMMKIDEGLLSELDTVGDFSVNGPGASLNTDNRPEKMTEVEQDNLVLESRSIEDINLEFKKHQGVDVNEVILPSKQKDHLINEEFNDHLEADSDLKVNEATSLEEFDVALKQISEGNQGELSKPSDLNEGSVKTEAEEDGSAKVAESIDAATSTEDSIKVAESIDVATCTEDSANVVESIDVATSNEEVSRASEERTENAPESSSDNKKKCHSRKSSSSSSSSDSD